MPTDRHSVRPARQVVQRTDLTDLLGRLACDDREEDWIILIQSQSPIIAAVCRGHLKQEVLVEDAVQETILAIRDGLPGLTRVDDRHSQAWITTIASNVARNLYHREHVRERHHRRFAEEHDGASADATADLAEGEALQAHVAVAMSALKRLPRQQRRVIELRFLHDLDNQRIADDLNTSQENVRTLLSRALMRLRRELPAGASACSVVALLRDVGPNAQLSLASTSAKLTGSSASALALKTVATSLWFWAVLAVTGVGAGIWIAQSRERTVVTQEISALSVLRSTGPVHLQRTGDIVAQVIPGQHLPVDSRILTGAGGEVVLGLDGSGELTLRNDSELLIVPGGRLTRVTLATGNLTFALPDQPRSAPAIGIRLSHDSVHIFHGRGYLMSCPHATRIDILAGRAELTASNQPTTVISTGQAALLLPGQPPQVVPSWGREFSPRWGGMYFRDAAATYAADRTSLDGLKAVGPAIVSWPTDREYAVSAKGAVDTAGWPFTVADREVLRVLSLPLPSGLPPAFELAWDQHISGSSKQGMLMSTTWTERTTRQGPGLAGLDWPRPAIDNPPLTMSAKGWDRYRARYRQVGWNLLNGPIHEYRVMQNDQVSLQGWSYGKPVGVNLKIQGDDVIHLKNLTIHEFKASP